MFKTIHCIVYKFYTSQASSSRWPSLTSITYHAAPSSVRLVHARAAGRRVQAASNMPAAAAREGRGHWDLADHLRHHHRLRGVDERRHRVLHGGHTHVHDLREERRWVLFVRDGARSDKIVKIVKIV